MAERQKVLIVDDERFNINVLVDLLKPSYKVMAAISGAQALKAARSASPPDLILLDIMMPEMDGYEVCRQLKADESTREIPIIFVTAMGQEEDETKGLDVGAVDYLTKPISPPIVEARVRTQLALRRNHQQLRDAYSIIEAQKKRMQDELDVGRDIQLGMVPRDFPDREAFSIRAALEPAREVGGDFYDFFELGPDRVAVCVGDVSGKGVPAALFMVMAKTLIKARATNDPSPASILTHVNDELDRENEACMFVTIWLGILDLRTGRLTFTNAGHNPPYVLRRDGPVERLEELHGPVVAAMGGLGYGEGTLDLRSGDQLLLYTDGVTEAMDPQESLYTEARLVKVLTRSDDSGVEEHLDRVLQDVRAFQAEAEQADDITVLALAYHGRGATVETYALELALANRLEEIERCNDAFNAFCSEHDVPEHARRSVNLVFDDLLNNVISYAYDDEQEHTIEVRVELDGSRMLIVLRDDGRPFNPFQAVRPDTTLSLEEREIGGLGIHLVRELMSSVAYTRQTGRNVVTLAMDLGSVPDVTD